MSASLCRGAAQFCAEQRQNAHKVKSNGNAWLKIPRCDTNGVGEYEGTVTSERHAQAERAKKQEREEKATSWGGADKDRA